MKKLFTTSVLGASLLALSACGESEAGELTVGGKNFTEQFVLSEITAIYLEENDYDVERSANMGSEVVREALENGQVDLYWEYTGTALVNYLDQEPLAEGEEAYEIVKEMDKEEFGIQWLDMAELNNAYTLMMRSEDAEEKGIESISDLADYVNENPEDITFATNAEFAEREDGLPGVEDEYGFEFADVSQMDSGLTYQALNDGQVEVAMGFETDPRIVDFDLVTLEDDLTFLPAYNGAVTVHEDALETNPDLEELLAPLAELLTSEEASQLNYEVDVAERSETEVAREWLEENGLLD
ncbi:glycine betaine ABC transporter substrate-binding protein [Texcoconibacillus texcoconensis]|uniref:Osmoprotectant transport system substrate-binding protein n=1 Tax=Texcoconibacillus texcoconensis TaxID=1095777 RepID=A0A840QPI6_9BACI|nr:glycine betaine ABC transporter substrate-binding protein [Texcoconibacillus texcoconensis]MBB5173322.1 osmoprotectant transport system substrate-binding protein [Texcoconibacillus texcoconensis]